MGFAGGASAPLSLLFLLLVAAAAASDQIFTTSGTRTRARPISLSTGRPWNPLCSSPRLF